MEENLISVTIVTNLGYGKTKSQTVKLSIPKEAAEIINKAWHSHMPQAESINAEQFPTNQYADVKLIEDGEVVGGIIFPQTFFEQYSFTIKD